MNGGHRRARTGSFASRAGVTLLELVVALCILAMLLAMIIPAVQSARESARMVECASHLRELGNAAGNFESRERRFPGGFGPRVLRNSGLGWSPQARMSADIGFSEVWNQFDFAHPPTPWSGEQIDQLQLAILKCPSDPGGPGSNYVGCTGSECSAYMPLLAGLYSDAEGTAASAVTDGLSYTAAFSERRRSYESFTYNSATDAWYAGTVVLGPLDNSTMIQTCDSLSSDPGSFYSFVGLNWHLSGLGTSLYNHVQPPNRGVNCFADNIPSPGPSQTVLGGSNSGIMRASSCHNGGANLLLGDGSVHFVADTIDLTAWHALGTIAGAEKIGKIF